MYKNPELSQEAIDCVFKNYPHTFRDKEKARIILDMRLGGVSYLDIGREVGLTPSRCREYVERVCQRYGSYLRRLNSSGKVRLFDKIKEMSVTELAEFLEKNNTKFILKADQYICKRCKATNPRANRLCTTDDDACNYGSWTDAELIREWLLQEVEG